MPMLMEPTERMGALRTNIRAWPVGGLIVRRESAVNNRLVDTALDGNAETSMRTCILTKNSFTTWKDRFDTANKFSA